MIFMYLYIHMMCIYKFLCVYIQTTCVWMHICMNVCMYVDIPGGHCARILSFTAATGVAGGYVLGPMSVPSERRNLSSKRSSVAVICWNLMMTDYAAKRRR